MDRQHCDSSAERSKSYLNEISSGIGHAARIGDARDGTELGGDRETPASLGES